jgi:hypothetical protein
MCSDDSLLNDLDPLLFDSRLPSAEAGQNALLSVSMVSERQFHASP